MSKESVAGFFDSLIGESEVLGMTGIQVGENKW
jgi:hypothetical protein